jgi:segregation and condensation protein A
MDKEEVLIDTEEVNKISQNQLYDVITSRKPDWLAIIYELIDTEQLDPWNIDLVVLTQKYFEKIYELEEADFYVSSKVLLAAALLLRIKSELLLNRHLKSIDEILFGKKEDKKSVIEKIDLNEDDIPLLIPKTPLPRLRRVTLDELTAALGKAIGTESRRIKKEVAVKRAKILSEVDFPTFKRVDLKDRIKYFYARFLNIVKKEKEKKPVQKVGYSELVGKEKEEKLACFLPMLHLSNTKKLWIEQNNHLEEIWIYLYEYIDKNRSQFFSDLEEDNNEESEIESETAENLDEEEQEIIEEVVEKLDEELEKAEKIDKITGFNDELE